MLRGQHQHGGIAFSLGNEVDTRSDETIDLRQIATIRCVE